MKRVEESEMKTLIYSSSSLIKTNPLVNFWLGFGLFKNILIIIYFISPIIRPIPIKNHNPKNEWNKNIVINFFFWVINLQRYFTKIVWVLFKYNIKKEEHIK